MVYEKKMLILSGEGSGVVMIEKSARGVRFALRTLGLARSDNARVGIITRKAVYVRDLPAESDPSAVFYIDDAETSDLHFAVFDARLRLYGTTAATRMWEANVMDLLNKYGAPVVLPERTLPTLPTLPPVSAPPKVLPAPDGTGIPQSRLDIYGDDALAENDIYTSLDFSARMREVDEFLDSPRVLDLAAGTPYSGAPADAADVREIARATDTAPQQYAHAETMAAKPYASALDGLSPHIMPPPDVPAYMLFPPDRDLSTTTTATTDAAAPEPRAPREAYASGRADSASAEAASVSEARTDSATNAAATGAGYDDGGSSADAREARREQAVTELSAAQKYDTVKAATASDTETASFIFNPVPPATDEAERGAEAVEHVEANAENGAAHVDGATDATAVRAESDNEILSNAANAETNTASAVSSETDMRVGATSVDADGDGAVAGMPWERTAKWLKARSERNPVVKRERVHAVEQKTNVATLREVAFFERCRADIEKLFSSAPKDEELTALLPDIEWVRVEFGGHAVGVGRSDNAFLCYAVAGQYEKASPLGDEAQWLPKLKNSPTGRGYWLIFQDLISGDILGN